MFKNEEEQLKKWKETIEKVEVSEDRLEQAIKDGFNRAKKAQPVKKRFPYQRSICSAVVAAILILTFVTSIRVLPVFAHAVASIPGMERFVEFILDDKGLESAVKNEYYQALDLSSEKEGVTLTIDGVITDEQEMVIFYSVHGDSKEETFQLGFPEITDRFGNGITQSASSMPGSEQTAKMNIRFNKGVDETEFIFKATARSNQRAIDYELPFSVTKEKMPTTRYPLNETVSIEGQKITIEQIEISPIKVAIHIRVDPKNTKKIFGFEDLRLVDGKGETWTSINNGFISTNGEEGVDVYFLQSNYFEIPDELTLMFNKLQALDKEEAHLLIDTDKGIILEQPSDQRYSIVQLKKGYFEFLLKVEKAYHAGPFNFLIDAEGKEINFTSGGFSRNDDGTVKITASFLYESFVNPIKLPLHGYPQWIEADVEIKIR